MDQQPSPLQNSSSGQGKIPLLPQPVFYGRIEFLHDNRTISYTDCWEISMLRFLHLVFADGSTISQQQLTRFMDKQDPFCQSLIQYFNLNPSFSIDSKYYTTKEGWKIRSEWCQFLNNSKVVKVKLEEKFQVQATVENSIRFFKAFFPKLVLNQVQAVQLKLQNIEDEKIFRYYEKILNLIYQQLSFNYKIDVNIESKSGEFGDTYFVSATQQIFLNGQHLLDWQLYSFYDFDSGIIGNRQTGHSDYRLH